MPNAFFGTECMLQSHGIASLFDVQQVDNLPRFASTSEKKMSTKTGCFFVIVSSLLCATEALQNGTPDLETSIRSQYHGKSPLSWYAERLKQEFTVANVEYCY
jgi:hypothetical protein